MSIFKDNGYLNPKYDKFKKFKTIIFKSLWTPGAYQKKIKQTDAVEFKVKLNEASKECVKRCILAVSVIEDKVKMFWGLISFDYPQTLISDCGALLSFQEAVHRESYHSLAEVVGVNRDEAQNHKVLQDRVKYLNKHLKEDPKITGKKRKLKKLVLFSALVERCSLFTQFYILMSFAKREQVLKSISALQVTTATEEALHYDFGRAIINIVKEETPDIWTDYLRESINKNVTMAYEAELKIIDWIFEKGLPSHITKEEVINILNFNFTKIDEDLDLRLGYSYDKKLLREKNMWFIEATKSPITGDFFDNNVGGYAFEKKKVDRKKFNFKRNK